MEKFLNENKCYHGRGGETYLSVKGDSTGLALGANSSRPCRMVLAAWFDFTIEIFHSHKFGTEKPRN
jgi:hypothetical protein